MKRGAVRRATIAALLLVAAAPPAAGQGRAVHGDNSVFVGHGVGIAWGVLKGPTEEETPVILRIVPAGGGTAAVRVEGVDPFTGSRRVFLEGRALGEGLHVRTPRSTFADFPRREIALYRTEADWQARRPTVTIFFLGLPDTTPEFASEAALSSYLDDALARAGVASKGRRP
jgi:hypothetical protein